MKDENVQKKKVVVLCASVACMTAVVPLLVQRHPHLTIAWLGLMMAALVFAVVEFTKWIRTRP